ncbi:MAG: hypothetical protein NVS3B7_11250 [Candidatus Elarobacter sp.]
MSRALRRARAAMPRPGFPIGRDGRVQSVDVVALYERPGSIAIDETALRFSEPA